MRIKGYILAVLFDGMRTDGETLIRQAYKLGFESWNERMSSSGEPIDPSPHRPSHQRWLDVDTC